VSGAWPAPLLGAALALGLAGSLHCVAMCGGIAAAVGARLSAWSRRGQALLFNLARLGGYALLGGFAGLLAGGVAGHGGVAEHSGMQGPARWPRLVAAILMLALGIQLLAGRDWLGLERAGAAVWRGLRPLTGRAAALPGMWRPLALGVLWGFLPCGLVWSALALAASSGSAPAGVLTMLAFGAGTLPAMLAATLAGQAALGRLGGRNPRRVAGLLMLAFAAWTALGALLATAGGHGAA